MQCTPVLFFPAAEKDLLLLLVLVLVLLLLLLHLQEWVGSLGEVFSVPLFVFGPKYSPKKRQTLVLINFIFASAKLAIWKSRKNKLLEKGWTDPVHCLRGLVAARLRVEHTYFRLTNNLDGFKAVWAVRQVLCSLQEDGSLVLHF